MPPPPPAPKMPGRENSSGLHAGASVFVPSGGARAGAGAGAVSGVELPSSSVQSAGWFKQLKQVADKNGASGGLVGQSGDFAGSGGAAAGSRGGAGRGGGFGSSSANSSASSEVGWGSKPTNSIDIDAAFGGAGSAAGLFTGLRMM